MLQQLYYRPVLAVCIIWIVKKSSLAVAEMYNLLMGM